MDRVSNSRVPLFGAAVLFAALLIVPLQQAYATTTVSSNITTNTTWADDIIVDTAISINSGVTLTVLSGKIVKFNNSFARITVNGNLDAQGTTSPIYFTSYQDDSIGGDTNGDGASSGAAGQWREVEVTSTGSTTISNAEVRFGGADICCSQSRANLYNNGGKLNLSNVTIATSSLYGIRNASGTTTVSNSTIRFQNTGVLQAGGSVSIASTTISNNSSVGINSSAGTLTVTDSTFSTNPTGAATIESVVTFNHSNNTATGTGKKFLIGGTMSVDRTWSADNIPYVISDSSLTINSGKTLTIDPGSIIKFNSASSQIAVNGTLNAQGTSSAHIYFTSLADDTVGGDTNDSTTTPASGNWRQIVVSSTGSSTISNARVSFGGSDTCCSQSRANLYNNGGKLSIHNVTVATSSIYGARTDSGTTTIASSTLQYQNTGSYQTGGTATITESIFKGNTAYGITFSAGTLTLATSTFSNNSTAAASIDNAGVFYHWNNTATASSDNKFDLIGNVTSDRTWYADNIPYYNAGYTVTAGDTLTVQPGSVVKFSSASARFTISGTMNAIGTAVAPIYFTSYADDTVGGDSNGAVSPAAGQWKEIKISSGATSTIEHAEIRYAGSSGGAGSLANVYNNGGTLTLRNAVVATSSTYGLLSDASAGDTDIFESDIKNNTNGVYVTNGSVTLKYSDVHHNSNYGVYTSGPDTRIDASEIYNNLYGFYIGGGSAGDAVVKSSNVHHNTYGVYLNSGVVTVASNTIASSTTNGFYNATAATTTAEYNYWGDSGGPSGGAGSGSGDVITWKVDPTPHLTVPHYLGIYDEDGTLASSVDGGNSIHWNGDFAPYDTAWHWSVSTWNTLGSVDVATDTEFTILDLTVSTSSRSDQAWAGNWVPVPGDIDTLELNGYTDAQRQEVITHELGHAHGLGHSYPGNIMHYTETGTTTLGSQDTSDYYYLWP